MNEALRKMRNDLSDRLIVLKKGPKIEFAKFLLYCIVTGCAIGGAFNAGARSGACQTAEYISGKMIEEIDKIESESSDETSSTEEN